MVALKLPLTANIVIHRANIERIDDLVAMALDMGASRVEIAHVQYYGWALKNRAALMPTREQVERAVGRIEPLRKEHHGRIVIDAVVPDYYARFPKPCVGGWGRRSLNVTPAGRVLPCHAAESIPGLEFWSVKDHSLRDIWEHNPAFNAFRGTDFLPAAVPKLRAPRPRFRRLPLPGLRAHRRRPRHRSGVPPLAAPSSWSRSRRRSGRMRRTFTAGCEGSIYNSPPEPYTLRTRTGQVEPHPVLKFLQRWDIKTMVAAKKHVNRR